MQVVRNLISDISMVYGLDKCAKIVLKKGKLVHSQNLILDFNRETQKLEKGKTHLYLRIEEIVGIHHQQMEKRLQKNCTKI